MCIGLTTTLDAIGCVTRLQLLRGLTHYGFLQMESTTSCRRETCTFYELTKVTLEFPFRA